MDMKYPMLAAAFVAVLASVPVLAANAPAPGESSARESDDACLQNNRLWSWNVVNTRTLSITDRTQKKFTLRLASGCVGLTNLVPDIEIRGVGALSCVRRGDFVRFVEPNLGRMSCTITSVEPVPDRPQPVRDSIN